MNARAAIVRALREPLVHFLAIGVVLFAAAGVVGGPKGNAPGDAITISEGQVAQLAESYRLLAGRLPSREELASLVDDFVTEEISYREAVAMGLDAGDTIVRRRMRQKLEFLIEDANASEEPAEADLKAWLASHAPDYRLPERRAIRQVLLAADKRGENVRRDADALLAKLKSGADPSKLGDPSMLPSAMPLTTEEGVAGLFGEDFAASAFVNPGKTWFGPVASPFGEHLVLVMQTQAGREAVLDDVRDRVRSDLIEGRRDQARDEFQERMRKRYHVRIDWPKPYGDLPATPDRAPKTRRQPEVGE
jgi:hypothetical protein